MKLYAIYKGGKRVKRYGVHKTEEKLLVRWHEIGPRLGKPWHFDEQTLRRQMMAHAMSIQVMGETE